MADRYAHRGEVYHITSRVVAWVDGGPNTAFSEIPQGYYMEGWRDAGHAVLTDLVRLIPIHSGAGLFGLPLGGPTKTAALDDVERFRTGTRIVPFNLTPEQADIVADAMRAAEAQDDLPYAERGLILSKICAHARDAGKRGNNSTSSPIDGSP